MFSVMFISRSLLRSVTPEKDNKIKRFFFLSGISK
jgi:hypothetical protein